jgi:hypothetical protein
VIVGWAYAETTGRMTFLMKDEHLQSNTSSHDSFYSLLVNIKSDHIGAEMNRHQHAFEKFEQIKFNLI